jgi:hypothetical protein
MDIHMHVHNYIQVALEWYSNVLTSVRGGHLVSRRKQALQQLIFAL